MQPGRHAGRVRAALAALPPALRGEVTFAQNVAALPNEASAPPALTGFGFDQFG